MNQKGILVILIVVILAIAACLTAYMLIHSQEESYMTLRISNSCTIEVPTSNNTVEHLDGGMKKYSFDSSDLNITHQKSENNSEIKSIKDSQIKGLEHVEGNIYHNSSSGVYTAFIESNTTDDALIISSSNLDLLKKVSSSVKFKNPKNTSVSENNTTDESGDSPGDTPQEQVNYEENGYSQENQNTNPETPSTDNNPSSNSEQESKSKYPSVITG